jgi:hypothetical protein
MDHPLMRLTAYVRSIALACLVAACGSSETFDPSQVDLIAGSWNANLSVGIYDTATATSLICSTSWTATFDTTSYGPDLPFVYVPESVMAVCPGFPDRLWLYAGTGLIVTWAADTVILHPIKNYDFVFAKLVVRSVNRLSGPVDPYYDPRGPLELTR